LFFPSFSSFLLFLPSLSIYIRKKDKKKKKRKKKKKPLLDYHVSSLRRGHAKLLCIVPIFVKIGLPEISKTTHKKTEEKNRRKKQKKKTEEKKQKKKTEEKKNRHLQDLNLRPRKELISSQSA
jgi:hypothetical protein